MSALQIEDLAVNRGAGDVISGVSLTVAPGHVVTVVGPNGAGKTSLLDAISGVARASAGKVLLNGEDLTTSTRTARVKRGIVHVQQGRAVFPSLTVRENIQVSAGKGERFDEVLAMFPELEKRLNSSAKLLSGGEQQMVVLARAIAAKPEVLLIDEMSLGLAPVVFLRLIPLVEQIAKSGVGVLLVEQFAHLALGISSEALVVASGHVTYQGDPKPLLNDPELLRKSYLG